MSTMKMPSLIDLLLDLAYPRLCVMCGRKLQPAERHVCAFCLSRLPCTDFHLRPDNPMAQHFFGQAGMERAAALLFYHRGDASGKIIRCLKYGGMPDIGVYFGRFMGNELASSGFFDGIDLLIPVPLSPGRRRWRGYNQAERIAFGLSQVTGIPLSTEHLFRLRDNPSQTALDSRARLESMRSLFSLKHPETLAGKHVLLIDDVFTTGATLQACVGALSGCPGIHFSLLTLACTAS